MRLQATLRAGCKVNLYLHIGNPLPNGYHELESVFIPLEEPHDTLRIRSLTAGAVTSSIQFQTGSGEQLPDIDPVDNTLIRALQVYGDITGFTPLVEIEVIKGIPHGAGLGGGSADAASILLWLQQQAAITGFIPLSRESLITVAASIGADVPFFLLGRTAFAEGIGEKLVPCQTPFAGHHLVLVCPDTRISTKWAFSTLDAQRKKKKDYSRLTTGEHHATYSLARVHKQGNDFEDIVFAAYPFLGHIYERLVLTGAEYVSMSGTGSAMFAVYSDKKNAETALKILAQHQLKVYMQRLPDE